MLRRVRRRSSRGAPLRAICARRLTNANLVPPPRDVPLLDRELRVYRQGGARRATGSGPWKSPPSPLLTGRRCRPSRPGRCHTQRPDAKRRRPGRVGSAPIRARVSRQVERSYRRAEARPERPRLSLLESTSPLRRRRCPAPKLGNNIEPTGGALQSEAPGRIAEGLLAGSATRQSLSQPATHIAQTARGVTDRPSRRRVCG
jgi:hypothetical protein